jgi:hypothetical protein
VATYAIPVFYQHVVVTTNGDKKQYNLHVVEDVDPLFSLRSLTANIDHLVCEVAQLEDGFGDTGRP